MGFSMNCLQESLSAAGKYRTRQKYMKKQWYKIFSFQYVLVIAHLKTQSSQASYAHLSAFLEDDVQRCGPEIVTAFSTVKHVCSSFHSCLSSPHQNEASCMWSELLQIGQNQSCIFRLLYVNKVIMSLLYVNVYTGNLLKILNQKIKKKKERCIQNCI